MSMSLSLPLSFLSEEKDQAVHRASDQAKAMKSAGCSLTSAHKNPHVFDLGGPTTDVLLFSNSKDFQEYHSSMLWLQPKWWLAFLGWHLMGAFHVFLEFAFFQFMSNHTSALASAHKSLPKPMMRHQILEAIILPHVCLSVEDSNVRNRMKRILTKFQPEQSHPLEGKRYLNVCQHIEQLCVFGLDKPNVGNRLKSILAKFEAMFELQTTARSCEQFRN